MTRRGVESGREAPRGDGRVEDQTRVARYSPDGHASVANLRAAVGHEKVDPGTLAGRTAPDPVVRHTLRGGVLGERREQGEKGAGPSPGRFGTLAEMHGLNAR
jgi:hypothetical protein